MIFRDSHGTAMTADDLIDSIESHRKRLVERAKEAAWRRTFEHRPHSCSFVDGFCVDCGQVIQPDSPDLRKTPIKGSLFPRAGDPQKIFENRY